MGGQPSWFSVIGEEKLHRYVTYAQKHLGEHPIVSVGSGLGIYEKRLENKGLAKEVICVDPEPNSYQQRQNDEPVHLPDYSTVEDLVRSRPAVVGACHLLLIWPLPNDHTYDVDAVIHLRPCSVIAVCERSGGSGSDRFLAWASSFLRPSSTFWAGMRPNHQDHIPEPYHKVASYEVYFSTDNDSFHQTLFLATPEPHQMAEELDNTVVDRRRSRSLLFTEEQAFAMLRELGRREDGGKD